jgi:hypothetical protein
MTKTDTNLKSWGLQKEVREVIGNLNGEGYSETLKFSLCEDVVVQGNSPTDRSQIRSGHEDCLDIVRGSNYTFKDLEFHCTGLQGATIKGSANCITFENCIYRGTPKNGYVVMGQYCDYDIVSKPKTRNVRFINCIFENPEVGITLWNAKEVTFVGQSIKINKINPLIVWGYFTFRKIYDLIKYGKYGRGKDKDNLYRMTV